MSDDFQRKLRQLAERKREADERAERRKATVAEARLEVDASLKAALYDWNSRIFPKLRSLISQANEAGFHVSINDDSARTYPRVTITLEGQRWIHTAHGSEPVPTIEVQIRNDARVAIEYSNFHKPGYREEMLSTVEFTDKKIEDAILYFLDTITPET
jgi:fructose-bisphosphate aldolase class 1